jgi:8-oxo-dGTP pyrophosphatase MutT (NUDIX family)
MEAGEKPWRSSVLEVICRTPYFSTLRHSVELTDGGTTEYFTLDFPGPAVGIIARRDDRYLLIRQYRFTVDEFVWAIPSGGVASGETELRAALRELEEETGFRSDSAHEILRYYPSYGCGNQEFVLFLADGVEPSGHEFDRNEVLEVRWFSSQEVLEMVLGNGVVDGLSLTPLAVLLLAEANGRFPRSR